MRSSCSVCRGTLVISWVHGSGRAAWLDLEVPENVPYSLGCHLGLPHTLPEVKQPNWPSPCVTHQGHTPFVQSRDAGPWLTCAGHCPKLWNFKDGSRDRDGAKCFPCLSGVRPLVPPPAPNQTKSNKPIKSEEAYFNHCLEGQILRSTLMFYSPRLKFHLSLAAPKESLPSAISRFPRLPTEPPVPCQTKLSFYSNYYCVLFTCVSLCGYVHAEASALRLEEYTGSPEAGIAGTFELPDLGAGN